MFKFLKRKGIQEPPHYIDFKPLAYPFLALKVLVRLHPEIENDPEMIAFREKLLDLNKRQGKESSCGLSERNTNSQQ